MSIDDELAELVRQSGPQLMAFGYQLCRDVAGSQDLVNAALLAVLQRGRNGRMKPENLYAYVRKCMLNDYLSNRRRGLLSLGPTASGRDPDIAEPGSQFGAVDERDEIWRALGRLGAKQRAALVLRYYEDLPDDQIARLLGCRRVTVRTLVARGLGQLRTAYATTDETGASHV